MNFQPPEQDDPRDDDDREQAASPPPEIAILKEQLNACVATLQSYYKADATQPPQDERGQRPAIQRFNEAMANDEESPLERLRFFCALAMSGQDFLDVEPFFDALAASAPAQQVEESQYRDNNWWLGWNAAIRSMQASPPHGDLLTKISDAWTNYERMGEVCQFEGQPMIYASTLEEIHDAAISGTGSDESKESGNGN